MLRSQAVVHGKHGHTVVGHRGAVSGTTIDASDRPSSAVEVHEQREGVALEFIASEKSHIAFYGSALHSVGECRRNVARSPDFDEAAAVTGNGPANGCGLECLHPFRKTAHKRVSLLPVNRGIGRFGGLAAK